MHRRIHPYACATPHRDAAHGHGGANLQRPHYLPGYYDTTPATTMTTCYYLAATLWQPRHPAPILPSIHILHTHANSLPTRECILHGPYVLHQCNTTICWPPFGIVSSSSLPTTRYSNGTRPSCPLLSVSICIHRPYHHNHHHQRHERHRPEITHAPVTLHTVATGLCSVSRSATLRLPCIATLTSSRPFLTHMAASGNLGRSQPLTISRRIVNKFAVIL